METKDWLLFLGPILGVVVTSFFGLRLKRLELRHNINIDRRERILTGLRELSDELDLFLRAQQKHHHVVYHVYSNTELARKLYTAEQLADAINDRSANLGRIHILQKLYAPEIDSEFVAVLQSSNHLTNLLEECILSEGKNLSELKPASLAIVSTVVAAKNALLIVMKEALETEVERTHIERLYDIARTKFARQNRN